MKKKLVFIVFLFIFVNVSAYENEYTFDGDFTYQEVLNALSIKTNRSVLGSSKGLEIKRRFDIIKKPFFVAVDQVRKNFKTDGYDLIYDENSIYVTEIILEKESNEKKSDSVYTVYLPYSKKFLVTEDKQTFLNAKFEDKQTFLNDSLKRITPFISSQRCSLIVYGVTSSMLAKHKINIGSFFNISVYPQSVQLLKNITAEIQKEDSDYNFYREIVTYAKPDTLNMFVFGSETRREQSVIESDNFVRQNFESVYSGLRIILKGGFYTLVYRVNDSEINISGVSDSLIYGASTIMSKSKGKKFYIFPVNEKSKENFYLIAKMKISDIYSVAQGR